MLTLTTPRLLIRPFTLDDLPAVHQMLDQDPARGDPGSYGALSWSSAPTGCVGRSRATLSWPGCTSRPISTWQLPSAPRAN